MLCKASGEIFFIISSAAFVKSRTKTQRNQNERRKREEPKKSRNHRLWNPEKSTLNHSNLHILGCNHFHIPGCVRGWNVLMVWKKPNLWDEPRIWQNWSLEIPPDFFFHGLFRLVCHIQMRRMGLEKIKYKNRIFTDYLHGAFGIVFSWGLLWILDSACKIWIWKPHLPFSYHYFATGNLAL